MEKKPAPAGDESGAERLPQLNRRAALAGSAGLLALAAAPTGAASAPQPKGPSLDLANAHDNCKALIKLQADLSGKESISIFPGECWASVPGEGNSLLFRTIGIGASHVEWVPAEKSYRFYHREALLYLDPKSGQVLESWFNPWTQRTVEVLHILNEHVNRYYQLDGGPFRFPWPWETNGDQLVFRINVFRCDDSVMPRREYPLHSQNDKYQSTELWGMVGSLAEVQNPAVTSAGCVTSWTRISNWQPFMEMGNAPGQVVYHSDSYKLRKGRADLDGLMPPNARAWLEEKAPQYFESPREWNAPADSVGTWGYSKAIIDERRRAGLKAGQTPFSWPRS
jgi:hypothetical protein